MEDPFKKQYAQGYGRVAANEGIAPARGARLQASKSAENFSEVANASHDPADNEIHRASSNSPPKQAHYERTDKPRQRTQSSQMSPAPAYAKRAKVLPGGPINRTDKLGRPRNYRTPGNKYQNTLDPMSRKPLLADSPASRRISRAVSSPDVDFHASPTSPKRALSGTGLEIKHLRPSLELSTPPVDVSPKDVLGNDDAKDVPQPNQKLKMQPETLAISHEQLSDEVKGIYAGLVMVENKCISVINALVKEKKDNPRSQKVIEHLPALISLHRTLLHEHHDFLLASQHPSASSSLKDLAARYSMPGRMWKHGIHSFLELLRHLLPGSRDYMLAYIYLSYQMIALLFETVPSFEDTWIECLGDLGRYRMAVEDDDQRDRDIWTGVSRYWYIKAADRNPHVGRLYHHQAILLRNQPTMQLSTYCRALTAKVPFTSAKESIVTLLEPTLTRPESGGAQTQSIEIWFIKSHALLFLQLSAERFHTVTDCYLSLLSNHIGRVTGRFREQGAAVVLSNIAGLLHYGSPVSAIWRMFRSRQNAPEQDSKAVVSIPDAVTKEANELFDLSSRIGQAWRLTFLVFATILTRVGDANTLPAVHLMLAFLVSFSSLIVEYDCAYITDDSLPWSEIATYLNVLSKNFNTIPGDSMSSRVEGDSFPTPERGDRAQPLPEDYMIRGETWAEGYFPSEHFIGITSSDDEERMMELPSTGRLRMERVLWLGVKLSRLCPAARLESRWLRYDKAAKTFSVPGTPVDFLVSGKFASTRQASTPLWDTPTHPMAASSPSLGKVRDVDVRMAGTEEVGTEAPRYLDWILVPGILQVAPWSARRCPSSTMRIPPG